MLKWIVLSAVVIVLIVALFYLLNTLFPATMKSPASIAVVILTIVVVLTFIHAMFNK